MSILTISQRQVKLLNDFTKKTADFLNRESPAVTKEVDYALLAYPLVILAAQCLKARGLSKDVIVNNVIGWLEKELTKDGPSLILLPGGKR